MKGSAADMGGWYKLPEGMPDPCEVVVIEWPPSSQCLVVEDRHGHLWNVAHWRVDCGTEFFLHGDYVHESDPRILQRLEVVATSTEGYSDEFRETARKILRRNGRG
jgi:hypothetical protein